MLLNRDDTAFHFAVYGLALGAMYIMLKLVAIGVQIAFRIGGRIATCDVQ